MQEEICAEPIGGACMRSSGGLAQTVVTLLYSLTAGLYEDNFLSPRSGRSSFKAPAFSSKNFEPPILFVLKLLIPPSEMYSQKMRAAMANLHACKSN